MRRLRDRPPLIDRVIAAVVPRIPKWLIPALAAVTVLGVLLIAWAVVA